MSDRRIRELYRALADDPSDEAARIALVAEEQRSRADVRADLFRALRDVLVAVKAAPARLVSVALGDIASSPPRVWVKSGVTLTYLPWGLRSPPVEGRLVGVDEATQTIVPLPPGPSPSGLSPLGQIDYVHPLDDEPL